MSELLPSNELKISDATLVAFVDDTGHETFAPGHQVYGLGGCVVMAGELESLIEQPWREVRRKVGGSPEKPLHAVEFSRTASKEDIEAVAQFFKDHPFGRIGATVTVSTELSPAFSPIDTIAAVLKNRILDIAKWTGFQELNIIFESSERANSLIQSAFGALRLEEAGRAIPVECFFMPKSANHPALEVADFIMHAVGRQSRRRASQMPGFVPDFAAVFHGRDSRHVSYIDVDRVEINSPPTS